MRLTVLVASGVVTMNARAVQVPDLAVPAIMVAGVWCLPRAIRWTGDDAGVGGGVIEFDRAPSQPASWVIIEPIVAQYRAAAMAATVASEQARDARRAQATAWLDSWERVREQRQVLLRASDWTAGNDAPLTLTQRAAWALYRQKLRDITKQSVAPQAAVWPVPPS